MPAIGGVWGGGGGGGGGGWGLEYAGRLRPKGVLFSAVGFTKRKGPHELECTKG